MYQRHRAFLGVLAVAVIAVACGPTDAGIGTKVKTNLTADETVKAAQIDVGVQKKVVTLSGTVDTPAIKERAVAVARRTDGVADVVSAATAKAAAKSDAGRSAPPSERVAPTKAGSVKFPR